MRGRLWPWLTICTAGTALALVVAASRLHKITFGVFQVPPIYGHWMPTFSLDAMVAASVAGAALAGSGYLIGSRTRLPTSVVLVGVVALGALTSAMVNLVRGGPGSLIHRIDTEDGTYAPDLHFIDELGIRGFTEQYSTLMPLFESWNTRTHPPGALVALYSIFQTFGHSHPLRIATAIAIIGMCAAGAAWLMGRTMGSERAGRIAAVLLVAAPGPLLFAYSTMDIIYAALLSTAAALCMVAIRRTSIAWAAAAGALLGLATFLTYATVFIALAAAVAILIQTKRWRDQARLLCAAGLSGLLALLVEWAVFGFDLLAAYQSVPPSSQAYDPYWIVGGPAAVMIFAGAPIASLGVAGLFRKNWRYLRPVLPAVLLAIMCIWIALPASITHLRPGEVERTWLFLLPLLAASAGVVVDRWIRSTGRWAGPIVGALVMISVAQAIVIQSLLDTIF